MIEFERRDLGNGMSVQFDGKAFVLRYQMDHTSFMAHVHDKIHIQLPLNAGTIAALTRYLQTVTEHLKRAAERTHTDAFQTGEGDRGVDSEGS